MSSKKKHKHPCHFLSAKKAPKQHQWIEKNESKEENSASQLQIPEKATISSQLVQLVDFPEVACDYASFVVLNFCLWHP